MGRARSEDQGVQDARTSPCGDRISDDLVSRIAELPISEENGPYPHGGRSGAREAVRRTSTGYRIRDGPSAATAANIAATDKRRTAVGVPVLPAITRSSSE